MNPFVQNTLGGIALIKEMVKGLREGDRLSKKYCEWLFVQRRKGSPAGRWISSIGYFMPLSATFCMSGYVFAFHASTFSRFEFRCDQAIGAGSFSMAVLGLILAIYDGINPSTYS